jgi:hypothetical protein
MAMVGSRKLGHWLVALALGSSVGSRFAVAGNDIHLRIVAATPDGRHRAVVVNGDGSGSWVCGLSKAPPTIPLMPEALEATAECGGSGQLLPFERWAWNRSTPEVRGLRALTRADTTTTPARIATDPDTQVRRIEVLHEGTWYPVLADEASTVDEASAETRYGSPGLTTPGKFFEIRGFLRSKDSIVVTFSNTDAYGLIVVDDAIAVSHREIVDLNTRLARSRDKAWERTKTLREQYAARSGAFKERGQSEAARRRSRAAVARDALRLWEQARVFGSLSSAELRDALWLLAWLDAPTRRQEAMRLHLELRERDPAAAEAVVRELAADPGTQSLAVHLQTHNDPLRGLPSVTGCSERRIAEGDLKNLSNESLLWLHRAQWAAQGCYRFSDPKVQKYFEGFAWYAPIPKDAWRVRVKKLRKNPDAPLLNKARTSIPADACKENLELILATERARGLSPPSL